MERNCEQCGTVFTVRGDRVATNRYCSIACTGAARRSMAKTCENCGEEFVPGDAQQRYCGIQCRGAAQKVRVPWACAVCGKQEALPPVVASKKKYCSQACHGVARTGHPSNAKHLSGEDSPCYKGGQSDYICEVCNSPFQRYPARMPDGKARYCSRKCTARATVRKGEDNSRWSGGREEVQCSQCGRAVLKRKRGTSRKTLNTYCGLDCRNAWYREHFHGEGSPRWRGGKVKVDCAQCGKSVERSVSETKEHTNHFCSKDCAGSWRSENVVGEKVWNWNGGSSGGDRGVWVRSGGMKWRRACRKRDAYTCGICGTQHKPHAKYALEVHHKVRFVDCEELRSVQANGITLCLPCHDWLHSLAGRPLREQWEAEALAELGHLLTQPEAQAV